MKKKKDKGDVKVSAIGRHPCGYCIHFITGKIRRRSQDDDSISGFPESKKKGKEKKSQPTLRECAGGKTVTSEDKSCKYFDPHDTIYCDNYDQRVNSILCLWRRKNPRGLKAYEKCAKCRQFDKEIQPIINDYYMSAMEVTPPPKKSGTKLKRRAKEEPSSIGSGKIKRRAKKEPKTKLKRRKKTEPTTKIKRRKR